jgi:hypothetical protein
MSGRAGTLGSRLLTRRCVACGYDGALLRGGDAERCARCGCDLHARPARSYAEMEGFGKEGISRDGVSLDGRSQDGLAPVRPAQPWPAAGAGSIHRWLAFLLMTVALLAVVGCLMAEVLAV